MLDVGGLVHSFVSGGLGNQVGPGNQVGTENKVGPGNKIRPPICMYICEYVLPIACCLLREWMYAETLQVAEILSRNQGPLVRSNCT